LSEAALIEKARAGDRDSFSQLVERNGRGVYGAIYHLLRNPEDSQDVFQEACLKAFGAITRFKSGLPFYPWLLRIGVNSAYSRLERGNVERRVRKEAAQAIREEGRHQAHGEEGLQALIGRERKEALVRALGQLPERARAILYLRYFEDMRVKDIAQTLDLNEGLVSVTIFRAKEYLRNLLEHRLGDEESR